MFYYARSDTHYLLYIYDMMRNELLEQSTEASGQNLVRQVLEKSKETSLRRHESFAYDAEGGQGPFGWYNLLIKQSAGRFSKEEFAVLRAVHKWRDETARREDESALYVMSNSTLFDLVRRTPPDPKALHSLLGTASHIAKREAFNLFQIISKAKAEGVHGPSVTEVIRRHTPSTIGIGEVAKTVFPQLKGDDVGVTDIKDLVSHTSKLWGNVPVSSRWEKPQATIPRATHFELPWARFVKSSKFLEEPVTQPRAPVAQEEAFISLAEPEKPQVVDDEFTLKNGPKRKAPEVESESESESEADETPYRPEPSSGASANGEEIAVPDDSDEEEKQRKAKKATKKAQKQARKAALKEKLRNNRKEAKRAKKEGLPEAAPAPKKRGGADEDEEAFDYSKAKSVLKSARATNGAPQSAKFNPYGMTADGPRPARKMHGEKPGKSATFRK